MEAIGHYDLKKTMNLAISNVLSYLDSYLKFLVWRIEEQSIV